MMRSTITHLRQLNPFRPPGDAMLPIAIHLSEKRRIALAILFYGLSIICAFFLFGGYAGILTPQKLLTTNSLQLATAFFIPIALFTLLIYFLTLGIVLARSTLPLLLIAVAFLLTTHSSLSAFIGGLLIFIAFLMYYIRFTSVFMLFKKPTLTNPFSISMALLAFVLSLAITISYYSAFSIHTERISTNLGEVVSKRFNTILNSYSVEIQGDAKNETLRSHAINDLRTHNLAINEASILQREKTIISSLGLAKVNPNDAYQNLLNNAATHEVSIITQNYKKMIAIVIPFAFFFVTNVIVNTSSLIASSLLALTDRSLRIKLTKRGVRDAYSPSHPAADQ